VLGCLGALQLLQLPLGGTPLLVEAYDAIDELYVRAPPALALPHYIRLAALRGAEELQVEHGRKQKTRRSLAEVRTYFLIF
jgi:hypothetical protein|tara:strand:+ start:723 stop:965 length:243 start_codon:yes stop_codon:yes gene_type:complete